MKINEDNRLCNLIAKCLAYGRKVGIVSDNDNIACLDLLMRKDTSLGEDEKPVPNDLEEAAWDCVLDSVDVNNPVLLPKYKVLLTSLFIDGAKWQKEQDEKEQADLFTIVALDAAQRAKEQMMKDIPKWHKVQRGSCFDKHTNFLLSAREGHFYCSSIEVPRDGYILLVDELERLPKEDEK